MMNIVPSDKPVNIELKNLNAKNLLKLITKIFHISENIMNFLVRLIHSFIFLKVNMCNKSIY